MTIIKYAGSRILADDFNGISPLSAIRAGTQSVTSNNSSLVNDDTLFLNLDADATYWVEMVLFYTGGTTDNSDMKFAFALPSGATANAHITRVSPTNGLTTAVAAPASTLTGATACATNGSSAETCKMTAVITTTSAGTMQLQWNQVTSSATATVMQPGSALVAWRIA
jgi:hypothetical protein